MARTRKSAQFAEVPDRRKLTATQAQRLAAVSGLEAKELVGQTVADVLEKHRWTIDPPLLPFRKVCGQVVRKDPVTGVEYPVPFATVHVEDTDCGLVWYGPPGWQWGWFYPLFCHREEIATVKTDECGRFCVFIPWFDIDWILQWRKQRICFPNIFVRPSIVDLIPEELRPIPERGPFPPGPDPGPLARLAELPPSVLSRLTAGATRHIADRFAASHAARAFGGQEVSTATLEVRAFTEELAPPLAREFREFDPSAPEASRNMQAIRKTLAGTLNVDAKVLEQFDPRRYIGPFFRCFDVWLPEWSLILDVPDITFRVTQDVNNDGTEETIYGEGFFDVRWNAGPIPNTTLYAWSNALVSHSCDTPDVPCGNQPAILYAGLMPLTNPPSPTDPYHDAAAGYARRPNRPHPSGNLVEMLPKPLAFTPFSRTLQLYGCVELRGAAFYRIQYSVDNGATFQPFVGLTWPLNRPSPPWQIWPASDGAGWYPVIPAADNWNPPNLLLEWSTSATGKHILRLELGDAVKNVIATAPDVAIQIDNTAPTVVFDQLSWKFASEPDSAFSLPGRSLLGICPTIRRGSTPADVEVLMKVSVSALHLRHATIGASGCGGAAPVLAADPGNHTQHWHTGPLDNSEQFYGRYAISASTSPEGAYTFGCYAASRAFNPAGHDGGHLADWNYDPIQIYTNPAIAVAVVNS
jgi:hypothetical protein